MVLPQSHVSSLGRTNTGETCRESTFHSHELCELVNRMSCGDESAFQSIFNRYYCRVIGLIRRFVDESEVEDVTQEVFTSVFHRIEHIKDSAAFESYLFRSARNRSINWLRKKMRMRKIAELAWYAASIWNDAGSRDAQDELMRLKSVLQSLPDKERGYIELFFLYKHSRMEMAVILNESPSTVYRGLAAAKAALLEATERGNLKLEFFGRHNMRISEK